LSQLRRAKISALGTYVPPRILTNADLEKMVDTTDEMNHGADRNPRAGTSRQRRGRQRLAVAAVKNLLASHPLRFAGGRFIWWAR